MTMLSTAERGQTRALVVGHDAYRAGAQLLLLHLLTWLKRNSDIHTDVLLLQGGELLPDFKTIAPTDVLFTDDTRAPAGFFDKLVSPFRTRLESSRRRLSRTLRKLEQVDVLYLNSVASLPVLPALKRLLPRPVICHVHALDMGIDTLGGVEMFRASQIYIDHYVAVSRAVADMLVERCGVPPDRIVSAYGAIDLANQGLRGTGCSVTRT